jgi:hypothetical protein
MTPAPRDPDLVEIEEELQNARDSERKGGLVNLLERVHARLRFQPRQLVEIADAAWLYVVLDNYSEPPYTNEARERLRTLLMDYRPTDVNPLIVGLADMAEQKRRAAR